MTTKEVLKDLCDKKNTTFAQVEKELGFANGSLAKTDFMRSDRLLLLSEYFNVSMEYIMTGKFPEIPTSIDADTIELIEMFNNMNKDQRTALMNLMRSFSL